ncbi:MAG: hypothetical protein ACPGR4_04760 [Paracoccaceae bacterium]
MKLAERKEKMPVKKSTEGAMVTALKHGEIKLRLIGATPFYYNSMSIKAKRDLLIGASPKTVAEKREIKHNPEEEFRDSVYKKSYGNTHLYFPPAAIKQAMATAAIETKGVARTNAQRLLFLPQLQTEIYGKPYLKIDTVRMANINKTPDMRTRAYLPEWCAEIDIKFVMPTLSASDVFTLLQNAGSIIGLGDFRQEKGRGAYGCFTVTGEELPNWKDYKDDWKRITKFGMEEQKYALDYPEYADEMTAELMGFLDEECARRMVA